MIRNTELNLLGNRGIIFPGAMDYLPDEFRTDFALACDAQPTLITTPNSGIPAWLTTYVDPKTIEVLVTKMQAAVIAGEAKKGDWLTETAMFPMVENTGETSTYGDFNEAGVIGANAQFPQRQSYHYQTNVQYGEKEVERMGLARLNWVGRLNTSAALTMSKYQNKTYFFGVAGLVNYGLLNDPNLSAPITPASGKAYGGSKWINNGVVVATPNEVYTDIQSLYLALQTQTNGLIDNDTPMTLAMSPLAAVALTGVNTFNVDVYDILRKNFPNIKFETAVEYNTASGQLVQLIVDSIEGQQVCTCAFTEKMRSHAIVVLASGWRQKKSQGTWGTIIWVPMGIAGMLGV